MTYRRTWPVGFLCLFVVFSTPAPAPAGPVLGGSVIVSKTGEVRIKFLGHTATYSNDLYLEYPSNRAGILFNNFDAGVGETKSLGVFEASTELVFRLHVNDTGFDYFSGPAAGNPDNKLHLMVDDRFSPTETAVYFEDLFNTPEFPGGFNDLGFSLTNVVRVGSQESLPSVKEATQGVPALKEAPPPAPVVPPAETTAPPVATLPTPKAVPSPEVEEPTAPVTEKKALEAKEIEEAPAPPPPAAQPPAAPVSPRETEVPPPPPANPPIPEPAAAAPPEVETPKTPPPVEAVPEAEEEAEEVEAPPPPPTVEAKKKAPESPGDFYKDFFSEGVYRIGAGSSFSSLITEFHRSNSESADLVFNPSFAYFLWNNIELNFDVSYAYTRVVGGGQLFRQTAYGLLIGSAYYVNTGEIVVPYFGAGVGWLHLASPTGVPQIPSSIDTGDGPQAKAYTGLKILISPSWTFDVEAGYRRAGGDVNQQGFSASFGFSVYLR